MFLGETVKQVSALDVHGALAVVGVGGADFYFYILCGALAYKEVVLLSDVSDNRLVEIIAGNPCGLSGNYVAEGNDGNLACTAAYIDYHIAYGLRDREDPRLLRLPWALL